MRQLLASVGAWADRLSLEQGKLVGAQDVLPRASAGRTPTVVAFHGYCGVPREVEVVCEAASASGLATSAPLLAGHGTSPADLSPLRFSDWVDSVRTPVIEALARGPVILAGLSLGSLVALELALELGGSGSEGNGAPGASHPVAGLILLGNALWLSEPFPGLALRAIAALGLPDFGFPKGPADLDDEAARRDHTTYSTQPVHGAISVQQAGGRLQGELHRVTYPTLILHGALDRTCPVSNAWRAAERLGSAEVEIRIFPRSHHVLTRDVERDQVRGAIEGFLRRWAT